MGREVNLLSRLPQTKPNANARKTAKNPAVIRISRQFGQEYFDGPREYGYGGYRYDGRWVPIAEDMVAQQYFLSYGLQTIRTRMFTHTGPRRGDVFAESAFAKQIAEIEAGVREGPMKVGNLDSVRTT